MKIMITDKAKDMINKTLNEKDIKESNVRLYIKGVGWGGPTFGIALDEQKPVDYNEKIENINYIVEKDLLEKYGGFKIDYTNGWLYKGFKIMPMNGGSSC